MRQTLNVVITGASAGLGRAMAHEFAKEDARVGLISRDLGLGGHSKRDRSVGRSRSYLRGRRQR